MSYRKAGGAVAAAVTALAFAGVAYGDGKSPNGPPGPAGNPNHPAAAPQGPAPAAAPQAKSHAVHAKSHSRSTSSHGNSSVAHTKSRGYSHSESAPSSHGRSESAPNRSASSHTESAHSNSGSNSNAAPHQKITICHATRSYSHPYTLITINVNGLHGHGPEGVDTSRHHAGSWKDIFNPPNGQCPTTPQQSTQQGSQQQGSQQQGNQPQNEQQSNNQTTPPAPEVATGAPAGANAVLGEQAAGGNTPAGSPASNEVLGAQASGGDKPAGANAVLGAQASGNRAPAAALAAHNAGSRHGTLPFTGLELGIILILGVAALVTGVALRRRAAGTRI